MAYRTTPSPKSSEIRRLCQQIRRNWTQQEKERRQVQKARRWELPSVSAPEENKLWGHSAED
jgi:hypothetical protein